MHATDKMIELYHTVECTTAQTLISASGNEHQYDDSAKGFGPRIQFANVDLRLAKPWDERLDIPRARLLRLGTISACRQVLVTRERRSALPWHPRSDA